MLPDPFLDLTGVVAPPHDDEKGLLGLVFAPDYATTGFFYVYYMVHGSQGLQSHVSRFHVQGSPAASNTADPSSESLLFSIPRVTPTHTGSTLAIRGGFLYLGSGDGGADANLAQSDISLFGKMLRFDLSDPSPAPEIWAKGFRNPYRFSFDRATGDLYVGDVGQYSHDEIDIESAVSVGGRNYGWPVEEGTTCYVNPNPMPGLPECGAAELVPPVHDIPHSMICAVVGGVVYRGAAIPSIVGHYFFSDYCSATTWSLEWNLVDGLVGPVTDVTDELVADEGSLGLPVAISEGGTGEVFFVDIAGEVFQLVPEPESEAVSAAALLALALLARRRSCLGR